MIGGNILKRVLTYILDSFKQLVELFSFLLVFYLIAEMILFMALEIVQFVFNGFFRIGQRITQRV